MLLLFLGRSTGNLPGLCAFAFSSFRLDLLVSFPSRPSAFIFTPRNMRCIWGTGIGCDGESRKKIGFIVLVVET